jgi:hypothetical protein
MSFALPFLFALTALFSIAAIWHAIASNWNAIAGLRRQMALPEHGAQIIVTLRENPTEFDAVAMVRRPRQLRVPAPKPVTHRLHHFARTRSVA